MSKRKPNTLRDLVGKQVDGMDTAFERMGVGIGAVTLGFWEWELTNKDVLSDGSLLRKDAASESSIITRMTTYARIWANSEEYCEPIGMGIYWYSAQCGYFSIATQSLGLYEINRDKIKSAIKASKRWRKAA